MTELPDVESDPRFLTGIADFNRGEFFEAGEAFEDLFFEAVRDEVEFVRVFLQVSVGIHHVERGQCRAAVERLGEALGAIGRVTNDRGYDLDALAGEIRRVIPLVEARLRGARERIDWPSIRRRP